MFANRGGSRAPDRASTCPITYTLRGGCEWVAAVFRVVFFGVFGGDPGGVLSGRGVWRCSDLFGFVQGCSGCGGGVDSEGWRWSVLSTLVNLVSTFVTVWSALVSARLWGERYVRHSCSGLSVAGVGGSGSVRWEIVGMGMGKGTGLGDRGV